MVIAPAKTGRDNKSNTAVTRTAQTNSGIRSKCIPYDRKFAIVLIKFTAPKREEIPAKCKEKIAQSTLPPLCAMLLLKGGYTVHPVPTPLSIRLLPNKSTSAGKRNQNLILLRRGKAMSGAPSIKGTSQFPNPPIKTGITIKKIIMKAWAVTITL